MSKKKAPAKRKAVKKKVVHQIAKKGDLVALLVSDFDVVTAQDGSMGLRVCFPEMTTHIYTREQVLARKKTIGLEDTLIDETLAEMDKLGVK